MTEPTRGARARRGNRRPGSLLLTMLLVLAIVSSSVLVFTNSVELLKLAVVVALWAAVVAAFVSFIYRRQADIDAAKARDLKLVYDLQLDREISARREYELSIESQLRRELASELRAETSDEVAALRAELAALRANLEIIFDTDLQSRPAIENERTAVHEFGDWGGVGQAVERAAATPGDRSIGPGRVISSRIDTEVPEPFGTRYDTDYLDANDEGTDFEPNTEESPIIDVPAEPQPSDDEWSLQNLGGAHRRPSEPEPADDGWGTPRREPSRPQVPPERRRRAPEPEPAPTPEVRLPWIPAEPPPPPRSQSQQPPQRREPERPEPLAAGHIPAGSEWRPAPAEGQYIPAGSPGSNWAAPAADIGPPAPAADPPQVTPAPPPLVTPPPTPAMTPPPTEVPRQGRHYPPETAAAESARRARHSSDADPARPAPPPTLATPPPPAEAPEPASARHRGPDDADEPAGQHAGGQPLSELMARLQVGSTGGGRRRRRDE